jgi:hypothetical protein
MKNTRKTTISLFIFLTTIFLQVHAQKEKVDWKNDIVTVNGTPYAKLVRIPTGSLTFHYSISGLNGPELIYIKAVAGDKVYNMSSGRWDNSLEHEMTFKASGNKIIMDYHDVDYYAKLIVTKKLIAGNALSADAEKSLSETNKHSKSSK